jgi:hypothetical protein
MPVFLCKYMYACVCVFMYESGQVHVRICVGVYMCIVWVCVHVVCVHGVLGCVCGYMRVCLRVPLCMCE